MRSRLTVALVLVAIPGCLVVSCSSTMGSSDSGVGGNGGSGLADCAGANGRCATPAAGCNANEHYDLGKVCISHDTFCCMLGNDAGVAGTGASGGAGGQDSNAGTGGAAGGDASAGTGGQGGSGGVGAAGGSNAGSGGENGGNAGSAGAADAGESSTGGSSAGCGGTCVSDDCHNAVCNVAGGGASCVLVDKSACQIPFCALGTGCPQSTDTDGDGLSDAWETNGYIDVNCNGVNDGSPDDVPLPGASPTVPDIYVAYDWMEQPGSGTTCDPNVDCPPGETCMGAGCSIHTTTPCNVNKQCIVDERCVSNVCTGHSDDPESEAPGAIQLVIDRFAARGFNLHVRRGHARPHSHVVSFSTPIASCEGANVASGVTSDPRAVNFYDLKTLTPTSIDSNELRIYHYAVFGHLSSCDSPAHCGACADALNPDGSVKAGSPSYGQTGIAEMSGNDLIISLGHLIYDGRISPTALIVGGTFMHELGHNLGLHHAGGTEDVPGFKPNYLSVMNYRYQLTGIRAAGSIGGITPDPALQRLDYSAKVLPVGGNTPGALDESQLNEQAGLGSGTADLFAFMDGDCTPRSAASDGPVDWDGSGAIDNLAAVADLNPQEDPGRNCGDVTDEVMYGHADWGPGLGQSQFTYTFQCTPMYADGAVASKAAYSSRELTTGDVVKYRLADPVHLAGVLVRPGHTPAWLALGVSENAPIAVLGTSDFDVSKIDPTTLRANGALAINVSWTDVNGDGIADLVADFPMKAMKLAARTTQVHVSATLQGAGIVQGTANVMMVPR